MYAYISGTLVFKGPSSIIVEAGGIGYQINTSIATLSKLSETGKNIKIYTHLNVKEDDMSLFGFCTMEELNMFKLLKLVSGVGPKVALAILSAISPSAFSLAVITNDPKTLTKAQGVGLKLAQRIILELKDKIAKEQKGGGKPEFLNIPAEEAHTTKMAESISALAVLGYTAQEANQAVARVYSDEKDLETLIMEALKSLAKI